MKRSTRLAIGLPLAVTLVGLEAFSIVNDTSDKYVPAPEATAVAPEIDSVAPPDSRLQAIAAKILGLAETYPGNNVQSPPEYSVATRIQTNAGAAVVLSMVSNAESGGEPDPAYVWWVGMRVEPTSGNAPATTLDIYSDKNGHTNAYWMQGDSHFEQVDGVLTGDTTLVGPAQRGADAVEDQAYAQAAALTNVRPGDFNVPTLIPLAGKAEG